MIAATGGSDLSSNDAREPRSSAGTSTGTAQLSVGKIISLAGIVVLVVFMIQNTDRVALDVLFWDVTAPLWLVTFASALVGAVVWVGLGVRRRHRRREARRDDRD